MLRILLLWILWASFCQNPLVDGFGLNVWRASSSMGKLIVSRSSSSSSSSSSSRLCLSLEERADALNKAWDSLEKKEEKYQSFAKVGVTSEHRLGLVTTEKQLKKDSTVVQIPLTSPIILTAKAARFEIFKDYINGEQYDGWTGDNGLIAMSLLYHKYRLDDLNLSKEQIGLMEAWLQALPSTEELRGQHPLLWEPSQQETLQYSSTKKIFKLLDDLEDDYDWWKENVFDKHQDKFADFTLDEFIWAMAIVNSRAVFVENALRLIPIMDMANHDSLGTVEIDCQTIGTLFGSTKAAILSTGFNAYTNQGGEVFIHYGPTKRSAEFLLDHGFVPSSTKTSTAELSFELDPNDRFHDDKLDILEQQQLSTTQLFDISARDEPDPFMIQFLRLLNLSTTDAFLLESIFRNDVWDFMAEPVSEINERAVIEMIASQCESHLNDMMDVPENDPSDESTNILNSYCQIVQSLEIDALKRTKEYMIREKEALDLKEYYQERRLKSLGLDSEWNPEDDVPSGEYDDDLSFGQTRAPGSLDW